MVELMAPTLVDARVHAEAVKAALNAELGVGPGHAQAWDHDELPGSPNNANEADRKKPLPPIFLLVSTERRGGVPVNQAGLTDRSGWRHGIRCVGRTVDECRWAMWKAELALRGRRLTIGGVTTTPVRIEAGGAPTPDDGRFTADLFCEYAL